MRWVGLTYSLPSGSSSSPRVAVWRRLRHLGAISPTGSLYVLPESEESLEALGWLAQEIRDGGGEALVLRVDRLEGDAEERLIEASRAARAEEYRRIAAEAEEAAQRAPGRASPASRAGKHTSREDRADGRAQENRAGPAGGTKTPWEDRAALRDLLEKLRRRLAEVTRIDFFRAPEGAAAAAALARLEAALGAGGGRPAVVPPAELARYRGRRWVTRPRPHVDRLASAWLIRRFVDPAAEIRYGDVPREGEISFDMHQAEFGHRGNLCTFETLVAAFGLGGDPALAALAEIVHEIDLGDGLSARPEVPGVDVLLRGWASAGWPDAELESHGIALFEGLYRALRHPAPAAPAALARGETPGAGRRAAGAPPARSASGPPKGRGRGVRRET